MFRARPISPGPGPLLLGFLGVLLVTQVRPAGPAVAGPAASGTSGAPGVPGAAARSTRQATKKIARPKTVPFIDDDYARALADARAKDVPLFVESWAPW